MGFVEGEISGVPCWRHSSVLPAVRHGFLGVGLDAAALETEEIARVLDVPSVRLLSQVHGKRIVGQGSEQSEADGFFIRKGDGACAVKTADCVPLLLISRSHSLAALLHCGWRGTVQGIVYDAMQMFNEEDTGPEDVFAFTGPAAGICCYEIGQEVAAKFAASMPADIPDAASPLENRNGKTYASVTSLVKAHLLASSVPEVNIDILDKCTICGQGFYSHRRGCKGRQITYIRL
jgi:YfiH family protein